MDKNILPFILCPNESSGDNVLSVSANSSLRWPFSNDQSGLIEIRTLSMLATSENFLVEIIENGRNSSCSNRAVHAKTIFGTFGKPFKLPCPILLPKLQTIQSELTDLSGNENDIRLAFGGYKWFSVDLRDYYASAKFNDSQRFYCFTTDSTVSLGGEGEDQNFISIENGDFICFGINVYSQGNFTYRIYDVNMGRGWQNGYVPKNAFGSAEYQNEFINPILLKKKTKLRIEFVNLESSTNNIYITFYGILKAE